MIKKLPFSVFNEYESDWKIDIPGRDEGNQYSWTEDPNVVTTMDGNQMVEENGKR